MSKQPEEPQKNHISLHVYVLGGLVALAFCITQLANLSSYSSQQREQLQKIETEYNGYQSGVKDSR